MREILFRAKKPFNGEWVEGYYEFGYEDETAKPSHYMWVLNHTEKYGEMFMVLPETIGQFTGLTDKNGNKIFEGDIVEYNGESGVIGYDTETARVVVEFDIWFTDFNHVYGNELEIIGNIHDNPDLVKGGE